MKIRFAPAISIFVLSAVLAVTSCSAFRDPIVGTWMLTAETINDIAISIGPSPSQVSETLTINADHTLNLAGTLEGLAVIGAGSWRKTGTTYSFAMSYNTLSAIGSHSLVGSVSADNKIFTGIGNGIATPGGAYTWTCSLQKK